MTRKELIEELARTEGISYRAAEIAVKIAFESMTKAMVRGDRVEIRGFGSFKIKSYGAYEGRNPKTGEIIKVKPKKLPFFKVGKELKERVEQGGR
ncbi:MAG: integration host factor subunit beta [Candidatus Aminicenantes bacterium]|nr:integration host factor subunit beta [Candidatus Aminicenantes bacterium]